MNQYQCQSHPICLINPYFYVTKIHNHSLLTLWLTWNCWRRKIKLNCDQSFWKLKTTPKSGYTRFSASLRNEDKYIADEEETDTSTHFLRSEKNQLIDLMQNLERSTNTLPVFDFNSGRYDINLIKSYLIPYLINEKEIEPSVIKKANDFVSCKFGDVKLMDIMKFLGGATTLDIF